jgi:hypothetical protein
MTNGKDHESMSRFYAMKVQISGHDPAKVSQIQAAAGEEWPFDDWWLSGEGDEEASMQASAEHRLCGGVSEEEFVERLSVAIWRANGSYCKVVVDATFLENLPYETHTLDESDYVRLIQAGENEHEDHVDC